MCLPEKTIKCPVCGDSMKAVSCTDWDSLVTYYYGQCDHCGFQTHHAYESELAVYKLIDELCLM